MSRSRTTVPVDTVRSGALSKRPVILDIEGKPEKEKPVPASAKIKQSRIEEHIPYITFRFLVNRRIDLGDGENYAIPSRPREAMTSDGPILIEDFNLEKIHRIRLRDENPKLREKGSLSDSMYNKILEAAEETAVKNRYLNDIVRYNLESYVVNGTIEILEDPFDGRIVTDSDYAAARDIIGKNTN